MSLDPVTRTRSFFGDKAEAYRASRAHGNPADLARMVECLRPAPGARALDVATGGGHTARALKAAGCRVVATDATPSMLQGQRDLGPILADAHALPFRAAAFDVVASRIAPHHFASLPRFVREAARILRPGGALYVFDLTTPEDPGARARINALERLRDPSHLDSHPPSAWRTAIHGAGLTLERLESTASEFDLDPWVARAAMPPEAEAELRRTLAARPPLGGYGLTDDGRMRVLRVELLARRPEN